MGSVQHCIGPSLFLSWWSKQRRWAYWWLMTSLSARAGAAFLCSRAGCTSCFSDGNTITSSWTCIAPSFSSLPSLDVLTACRGTLAWCEVQGAATAGSFPSAPVCLATGLQDLGQQLIGVVCAISNPYGFHVTGNGVI